MAMLSAAQLLDELMGQDRNLAPDEKTSGPHYSDPEVMVHFPFFKLLLFGKLVSNLKQA